MILPTLKSGFVLLFLLQGIMSAPQELDASEMEHEETGTHADGESGTFGESEGGLGGHGGHRGGHGAGGAVVGMGGSVGGSVGGGSGMAGGIAGSMAGGRSGGRGTQGSGSGGYSSSMSLSGGSSGGSGSGSSAMNLIVPGMALGGGRGGVMDLVGAVGNMAVRGIEAGHEMGAQSVRTAADVMAAFPRALAGFSSTGQNVHSLSIPGFSMNMQRQGQQPGYSLNSLALQGLPSYTISSQALQGQQPGYNANIDWQSLQRQMPSSSYYSVQQSGSGQTGNGLSADQIAERIGSFGNTVGQGVQQVYSNVPRTNGLTWTSTDSGNSGSSTGINGYTLTVPSGVSNGISDGASLLAGLGSSFVERAQNMAPQASSGSSGSSSGTISSYANLLPEGFTMQIVGGNNVQLMNGGKVVATFAATDFYNEMNKSDGNIIQAFMNMMSNGAMAISSGMSDIWSAFTSGMNNLWGGRIRIPIPGF